MWVGALREFSAPELHVEPLLTFGSNPEETTRFWLKPRVPSAKLSSSKLVVAIGHEPHLSSLLHLWSGGSWPDRESTKRGEPTPAEGAFRLRKSGLACLEVHRVESRRGAQDLRPEAELEFELQWLLRPSLIRLLTGS
jgi:phosphohistidine phosphatase SixA